MVLGCLESWTWRHNFYSNRLALNDHRSHKVWTDSNFCNHFFLSWPLALSSENDHGLLKMLFIQRNIRYQVTLIALSEFTSHYLVPAHATHSPGGKWFTRMCKQISANQRTTLRTLTNKRQPLDKYCFISLERRS